MHHAEDGGDGPDPQRQRHHGDQGGGAVGAELPHGEAQVAPERVQPVAAADGALPLLADLAALALHPAAVAEALQRRAPRLLRRHPARQVLVDEHLQVEGELVVHVRGHVGPAEAEVAPPERLRARAVAEPHAGLGAGCSTVCSTFPTACAKRSHSGDSAVRCRRPSGVRR